MNKRLLLEATKELLFNITQKLDAYECKTFEDECFKGNIKLYIFLPLERLIMKLNGEELYTLYGSEMSYWYIMNSFKRDYYCKTVQTQYKDTMKALVRSARNDKLVRTIFKELEPLERK